MNRTACLLLLLPMMMMALAESAYADGGRVRMQQTTGDFIVTLFTAPEPLTTGDADFSVLVQDRATQQVLLDASVDLQFTSPSGAVQSIPLTRAQASNKLLQASIVHLEQAGRWLATVRVHRGSDYGECSTEFAVTEGHSRRTIVGIFLLLPLLAIVLFIVYQAQRPRQGMSIG